MTYAPHLRNYLKMNSLHSVFKDTKVLSLFTLPASYSLPI